MLNIVNICSHGENSLETVKIVLTQNENTLINSTLTQPSQLSSQSEEYKTNILAIQNFKSDEFYSILYELLNGKILKHKNSKTSLALSG